MKKKILLALSLVAIMTVLLAISVSAAEPIVWDISATENDSVTAYLYENTEKEGYYTLTISGTGNMTKWASSASVPWYSYKSTITSATIENGVTNIGDYAFLNSSSLTSIVIPESVTTIGIYAFQRSGLTSLEIPASVTTIGSYAFSWCSKLTSIIIPESVSTTSGYVFNSCTRLTIYCEAECQPSGWKSNWNYSDCPVVWDYKNTLQNTIFTFKGYSVNEKGSMAVGYDIDYEAKAFYEELTGKALDIGVVFAGYDNLAGQLPLDRNGEAIALEIGKVVKASLTGFAFTGYDFMLTDIGDGIRDVKLVIAAYIYDGEAAKYVQESGISDTVTGISYNEAKESIGK